MAHPFRSTTHEEGYMHLRKEEPVTDEIRAKTIFLRKEADGLWYSTEATCVVWDQFCRRTGRQIARRRYFRWPQDRVAYGKERPKFNEVLEQYKD